MWHNVVDHAQYTHECPWKKNQGTGSLNENGIILWTQRTIEGARRNLGAQIKQHSPDVMDHIQSQYHRSPWYYYFKHKCHILLDHKQHKQAGPTFINGAHTLNAGGIILWTQYRHAWPVEIVRVNSGTGFK